MSKALVIPNVDFAANALTTVTLEQDIPCTGITLSDSTLSLTSLEPVTLTATVTPANTTDALTWASSDTSVATVVNGVVTTLKAGSVTITATCGSQSATCAISIHVFIDPSLLLSYYYSAKKSNDVLDTINVEQSGSASTYGATIITDGTGKYAYDSDHHISDGHAYPIMLPSGATQIKVVVPNQSIKVTCAWCDSQQGSGYGTNVIKALSYGGPWDAGVSTGDRTIDVASGADSFYLVAALSGGGLTQEILDTITVEALYTTET